VQRSLLAKMVQPVAKWPTSTVSVNAGIASRCDCPASPALLVLAVVSARLAVYHSSSDSAAAAAEAAG
jgi:hypothetical protein